MLRIIGRISICLLLSVALCFQLSSDSALAESEITITANGAMTYLQQSPMIVNDRVLIPLRDASPLFDAKVFWDSKTKSITILGIGKKIVLQAGSKKASVNGEEYLMDVSPLIKDGVTYIPLRYVSMFFDIPITWDSKARTVDISYTSTYFVGGPLEELYWVHKENGNLYVSKNRSIPQKIGETDVKILDLGWIEVDHFEDTGTLLTITDVYGEPHINTVIHKVLLENDLIVQESRVHYWGWKPTKSIKSYDNSIVMIDNKTLKLVDPNGEIRITYDLAELGGVDSLYTVEGIGTDYLLIRSYEKGVLLLVDLHTNERIELYRELLDAEQQELIYKMSLDTHWFDGDQLTFTGEKDGILHFSYVTFFDNEKKEYEYPLPGR